MNSDIVYKPALDVSHQDMGDGQPTVILRLSDGQLYTCNRTARLFLEQVDGVRTLQQIADVLYEGFDVDYDALLADLFGLADTLCTDRLIQRV